MRMNRWFMVMILILGIIHTAYAQQVKHVIEEGSVEVRAVLGRTIEVVVASGVSSLVRSGDMSSLKVEHVSGHLFVTPLAKDPAELIVIDGIGRSYRLKFMLGQDFDEKVIIAPRVNANDRAENIVATIDFIRELASGRAPAGTVKVVREGVIFEDERVRISSLIIYEKPDILGYVLRAENLLDQSLVVPVEQLNFQGLLAITSEKDILSPVGAKGSQGFLYMVTAR